MANEKLETSESEKTKELERRYTYLLEQRVEQLEKLVSDQLDDDQGHTRTAATKNLGDNAESSERTTDTKIKMVVQMDMHINKETGARERIAPNGHGSTDSSKFECILWNVIDTNSSMLLRNEIELGPGSLRDLLLAIIPSSKAQSNSRARITFEEPFSDLVHSWDELNRRAELQSDADPIEVKEARSGLKQMLDYVEGSKDLNLFMKNRRSYLDSGVITFEHIWTLFPPNSEVISTATLDEPHILRVLDSPYPDSDDPEVHISCWYFDHDGTDWATVKVKFEIERFYGTRPINSLPCYPLKYLKDEKSEVDSLESRMSLLRTRLIKRGAIFKKLCTDRNGKLFDYDAQLLSMDGLPRNMSGNDGSTVMDVFMGTRRERPPNLANMAKKFKMESKIIIDPQSFREHVQLGGQTECPLGIKVAQSHKTEDGTTNISDDERLSMCPPRVLGWSAKRKTWCQFLLKEVKDVKAPNKAIFDKELQLDEENKKLIRILVEQHGTTNGDTDMVEGKGRGLVLLLHGTPGVGKTLTAEALAERTGKPLLAASVADIGLDAQKAEANLQKLFQLAGRWRAILLVDEADIFLESRAERADSNRNALISVLLRVLDYYEGIIILTTNRIRSLDMALVSRIHLPVRYDDLNSEQMCNILFTMLEKLAPGPNNYSIKKKLQEHLEDRPIAFNGRQIRNLATSALALAKDQGRNDIVWEDIRSVMKFTNTFQNQLASLLQQTQLVREVSSDGK